MPKQAVVFLKGKSRRHNKLYIKLILPDEQEVEYSVNAVRALGYTPQELAEMMILDEEPAEKIERYTGLNLSVLKPLAQKLGKTLML